jgi:hypothetical protein
VGAAPLVTVGPLAVAAAIPAFDLRRLNRREKNPRLSDIIPPPVALGAHVGRLYYVRYAVTTIVSCKTLDRGARGAGSLLAWEHGLCRTSAIFEIRV